MTAAELSQPRKKYNRWTDDELAAEVLKYPTRGELKKGSPSAYFAAYRRGLLDQICSHMEPTRRLRTDEELAAEALPYSTRGEFCKGSPAAYQAARKRGILDKICGHMEHVLIYWTDEDLAAEALPHSTRIDFQRGSAYAYIAALRRGILDQICSHMEPMRRSWTDEDLAAEALPYSTRGEFQRGSKRAYSVARRRGILDQICSHMKPAGRRSDNNMVYIWQVGGLPIYKVGTSSYRLGSLRMDQVAETIGFESNLITLHKTKKGEARKLEKELLKIGCPQNWQQPFDGHTEFRFWTSKHLKQAKEILANVA